MNQHEYCTTVCGAKCCVMNVPDEGKVPCPRLGIDNSCTAYQQRYAPGMPDLVVVGYWKSRKYKTLVGDPAIRPFWCGRVEQLMAAGQFSEEIVAQCCVIHPELLEDK